VKSKAQLFDLIAKHTNDWSQARTTALLPKAKVVDFQALGLPLDIDFVGFQHSFY